VQVNAIVVPLLQPLLEGTTIATQQVLYPKPSKMLARAAPLIKCNALPLNIWRTDWTCCVLMVGMIGSVSPYISGTRVERGD
jgi:hypothetical protein